jgi:hypothetical protein
LLQTFHVNFYTLISDESEEGKGIESTPLPPEIEAAGRIIGLLSQLRFRFELLNPFDTVIQKLQKEISEAESGLRIFIDFPQLDEEPQLVLPVYALEKSIMMALQKFALTYCNILLESDSEDVQQVSMDRFPLTLVEELQVFSQSVFVYQQKVKDQLRIQELLQYPEVFHDEVKAHLTRFLPGTRRWLFDEIDWWLKHSARQISDRVYWIRADPGMGKTTFAAALTMKLHVDNRLLGAYFCQSNANESASTIIRSWAAQSCQNLLPLTDSFLPKHIFGRAFSDWDQISINYNPWTGGMFDALLVHPLHAYNKKTNPSNDHPPMLLLIDGLDQLPLIYKNQFLHILSSKFHTLPHWVKILITSQPDTSMTPFFGQLVPTEINQDHPRQLHDIDLYLRNKLEILIQEKQDKNPILLQSEGRFIYVSSLIEDMTPLNNQHLPYRIICWYHDIFVRMKQTQDDQYFQKMIFPFLSLLTCSKEPLSFRDVKLILNLHFDHSEEQRLVNGLYPLFHLQNISSFQFPMFQHYHQSLYLWLRSEESSWNGTRKSNLCQILSDFLCH